MPLTTGERLNGIQEASGSIPLSSTVLKAFSPYEVDFFCFNRFRLIIKKLSKYFYFCYISATDNSLHNWVRQG